MDSINKKTRPTKNTSIKKVNNTKPQINKEDNEHKRTRGLTLITLSVLLTLILGGITIKINIQKINKNQTSVKANGEISDIVDSFKELVNEPMTQYKEKQEIYNNSINQTKTSTSSDPDINTLINKLQLKLSTSTVTSLPTSTMEVYK